MNKNIIIDMEQVEVPVKIEIDGKSYPITGWNTRVVKEYMVLKDEKILEKLKDFSLEI